jgi:hypothetical protein
MPWIWASDDREELNEWVAFRKTLQLGEDGEPIVVRIDADSRYTLFIDGVPVGVGPARAFPASRAYDEYTIPSARSNTSTKILIEVTVTHFGICTFQYITGPAGVWVQVLRGGQVVAESDPSWECARLSERESGRFRISCQQAWQEIVDHRVPLADWLPATAVAGEPPLNRSTSRVDLLSPSRPLGPVSVVWSREAEPPATMWSIALREVLLPGYTGAAPMAIRGLVGVTFHVKHECEVVYELDGAWFWVQAAGSLNGRELEKVEPRHNRWSNGIALKGRAKPGENFVVFDVSGTFHEWQLNVVVGDLVLGSPEFLVAGPFDEDVEQSGLRKASSAGEWQCSPLVRRPDPRTLSREGLAFQRTAFARLGSAVANDDPFEIRFGETETQVCLDLGRMTAGHWAFEVLPSGSDATVWLNGFEAIQEGVPDYCWEMANTMEVRRAHGRQLSLIRRGARYVVLQGSKAVVRGFGVLESGYRVENRTRFKSSEPDLDRIREMCALTAELCSEDTFVDCPTYEQTFWVGDARNEALIDYAVFGNWNLAKRCWLLAAESLSRSPMVECHVPSGWPNIIPAWSFLWAMGCWEHYWYTADRQFLEAVYPAMKRQLSYCEGLLDREGLFAIEAWNLCEWAPMDQPGQGIVTHNQGWLCLSAEATARAAETLAKPQDADWARSVAARVAQGCNNRLWDAGRDAYTDCIKLVSNAHSDVFSLQTQVVLSLARIPIPERQLQIDELILESRPGDGFVQVGTPFFMFFVHEYLETLGRYDLIIESIRDKWDSMAKTGATTCWELFPGFMHNGRWTRSHCHAWSAGPAYFLSRHQLGLIPTEVGLTRFRFEPRPSGLRYCEGEIPTPNGILRASWRQKGDSLDYEIEAPDGVVVDVRL